MRILFVLPGFHRVQRGAEVALESVATQLAAAGEDVTLIGNGRPDPSRPYTFVRAPAVRRERFERWPNAPLVRNEYMYEDLTFVPGLLARFRPGDFDVTVTCAFPHVHWALRRPARKRPKHVFVTQNGDWPAFHDGGEARFFDCDGLVCTNPEYYERNRARWHAALVPNGVDTARFHPGAADRARLGLPEGVPLVLMVSALITSKRVDAAVRAVAQLPDVHLVVAGDGPDRGPIEALATAHMPGRFHRVQLPFTEMPDLYRAADVFLHTTLLESFGNVYIEALATGMPIVAHESTVTRWILEDHAHLVDTEDDAALVGALHDALAARPDDIERRVKSADERFSWPAVGDAYRTFLRDVLDR